MIPLKVHNVLDYIIALSLVTAPFIAGFSDIEVARNLFVILGVGLALYSLITKYYYSIAKVIPIGVHMTFDALAGIAVIAAPYLMDYRGDLTTGQMVVHVVMGAGAIGLVALTKPRTESAKTAIEMSETTSHHFTRHGQI